MNTHVELADTRITDLQNRLQDANSLLIEALGLGKWRDPAVRTNLKLAIRTITAVSADIGCICQQRLDLLPADSRDDAM